MLVVLALVRDQCVRSVDLRDRDDAVDRLDEVRIDARRVEAERPVVERLELRRQRAPRQIVPLPQELERQRVSARNSLRRFASSSYKPRQNVVTVREPSSSTP